MFIPDTPNEDLGQLRELVADFIGSKYPASEAVKQLDEDFHYDRAIWKALASELGLAGLGVDEASGGSGGGIEEVSTVFVELGRTLAPTPYFGTVGLASILLQQLPSSPVRDAALARIATGDTTATVAFCGSEGSWDLSDIPADASEADGVWTLTGTRSFVIDGAESDLLLVPARTHDGISVFAVEADTPSLTRTSLRTLDLTRPQAHLAFAATPVTLLGEQGAASVPLERALHLSIVALVSEQLGAAEYVLSSTIEYAKLRYQFGRPIGGFQAIKHKLADMVLDLERMKSAVGQLVELAASNVNELPTMVHLSKAFCSEAFFRIAAESVQIYGGIGFTWEHPAHLYFRRAKSTEQLLGTPEAHRESMLHTLGVGRARA